MIEYSTGKWGILFILSLHGSVIPKATIWSASSAVLSIVIWVARGHLTQQLELPTGFQFLVSTSFFSLSFLLVFRTQIAYSRYWDGITILHKIRGSWYNCYSSLFAFASRDPAKKQDILKFKRFLARIFSLLHCCALQKVACQEDENYSILGTEGIDEQSLCYLTTARDRCEVVLQWAQQLIVDQHYCGILPIPPPILSRVFQELSNGIVDVNYVCTITETPFPFPYSQVLTVLLIVATVATSFMSGLFAEHWLIALVGGFSTPFTLWSINYIAQELEQPFGDDINDLPVAELQETFNGQLFTLLDEEASKAPEFIDIPIELDSTTPARLTVYVPAVVKKVHSYSKHYTGTKSTSREFNSSNSAASQTPSLRQKHLAATLSQTASENSNFSNVKSAELTQQTVDCRSREREAQGKPREGAVNSRQGSQDSIVMDENRATSAPPITPSSRYVLSLPSLDSNEHLPAAYGSEKEKLSSTCSREVNLVEAQPEDTLVWDHSLWLPS